MELKKRGVSPVIATVLLVGMVIVLGLIIFLWMRSLAQEIITKEGENIELACDKVEFTASKVGDSLTISNGNVPIFDFAVKISVNGGYDTVDASELFENEDPNWPRTGLNSGRVFSSTSDKIQGEITLIPILLGKSDSGGQKKFTCNEKRHGQKVQ